MLTFLLMPPEIRDPMSVRGRNPDVNTNHIPSFLPQEAYSWKILK